MKTELKFTFDSDSESRSEIRLATKALTNAELNQSKIDDLYDDVFRPVIKYGEDEAVAKVYEEVWVKLVEHFELDE